jgi:hypothetical protein
MSKTILSVVYSNAHLCLVNVGVSEKTSSRQFVNKA